jgi:hypothetical protein
MKYRTLHRRPKGIDVGALWAELSVRSLSCLIEGAARSVSVERCSPAAGARIRLPWKVSEARRAGANGGAIAKAIEVVNSAGTLVCMRRVSTSARCKTSMLETAKGAVLVPVQSPVDVPCVEMENA